MKKSETNSCTLHETDIGVPRIKEPYIESMFMDSGAHSLYNIHVLKLPEKKNLVGKHGKALDMKPAVWSRGDFSYFDLSKGSDFRKYCDSYARFMRKFSYCVDFFSTVDAISNPDLTWEIQRYFEDEHGVQPVPIVHFGTPLKYVDRYLEAGKYDLLGVGGLGQGVSRAQYYEWGDSFFLHICPKENDYMPLIRTHGFAMTSVDLMLRYPWWSVDSATWVKVGAFGQIYVPKSDSNGGFDLLTIPHIVHISHKSPAAKERDKHYYSMRPGVKKHIRKWLDEIGIPLGSVIAEGEENAGDMKDWGVISHHRARSISNIHYFQRLAEAMPKWPCPLNPAVVSKDKVKYQKGFGLC